MCKVLSCCLLKRRQPRSIQFAHATNMKCKVSFEDEVRKNRLVETHRMEVHRETKRSIADTNFISAHSSSGRSHE